MSAAVMRVGSDERSALVSAPVLLLTRVAAVERELTAGAFAEVLASGRLFVAVPAEAVLVSDEPGVGRPEDSL